ncbi:protein javelin isoform X2 [Drosophila nasuta]|uniref:protein javelin isoform X2 n=1 Tax=Drosophila nasuta TaxID=42062 RepID=UPI00295E68A9|nr:protein javelin isoform X2 [Drosophila nasuta]
MGHGYFRTSQTSTSSRQRDKRGKDSYSYQHNYVDRVRLEDTNGNLYQQQQQQQQQQQHHHASHHPKTTHDPRCPQLRAAGWRHTHKSVSHLDLATSCHSAAGAGIDHRHRQLHHHQTHHHQHHHQHLPPAPPLTPHAQPHWTQCRVGIAAASAAGHGQLRNARSLDYTQLEREENALDIAEFYWHFDAEAPHEQVDNYAVNDSFVPAESPSPPPAPSPTTPLTTVSTTAATDTTTATATTSTTSTAAAATVGATTTVTATYLDFGSESCSLRRSRSLAVIREETFSDLQIGSANSSRRRSQLIPRARLVNRGFFRESPRLHNKQQQLQQHQQPSEQPDADAQSHSSGATTCDSHQQQQLLKQQQQKQRQRQQQQQQRGEARDFDVYYDNLKRLDALALGLSEQLHPWHNDKSDLESLNSDYFKNSLHQNHADQLQPSSLEFEALEQAVTLLSERPRIYQSRRQQQQQHRLHHHCHQRHIDLGGESCPEHSQSSVFPETTTSNSNSDDQTDSPSLSEQEYDLTHIEQIFQQGESGEVEECYELISLTTTTRTRFESSEEEGNERELQQQQQEEEEEEQSLTTPTDTTAASDSDGTLKRGHSEQLDKLIAYDSVYLSSEDSSECTLIGESCESFEQRTSLSTECEEGRSLLHISIEDTVYEPQPKQHKKQEQEEQQAKPQIETQIFTQILKIEQPATITSSTASKPRILSVVEKRKQLELKQQPVATAVPPELKRQATDTFVVTSTHKSNLVENQYHSLPDVNIGVSLKVCESIDKELRTSYNLQRQQQRKESKRQKATTEHSQNQVVTRAETYDSIRRFGRAHQKARQIEYEHEERERQREKEASTQEAEKETTTKPAKEANKVEVKQAIFPAPIEVEVRVEQEKEEEDEEELPLPPPPPPLTEAEDNDDDNHDKDNLSVSISLAEQPKEAPHIEVANFSKLIERRAQEIRQRKEQTEQQQQSQQQQQSFRIIVTDAQNNIIATEAIQEETKPSVNCTPQPPAVASTHSHSQRSLRRSSSTASGKPPERRVLSAGAPIYKARPIKVLATSEKMSRPQILHVVDSSSSSSNGHDPTANGSLRRRSSARSIASTVSNAGGEVAIEYLQKVDAVKCYWNKLAAGSEPSEPSKPQTNEDSAARLHFQLGDRVTEKSTATATNSSADYCSIMPPSIEIVELGDGAQKATIVSAAPDGDDDDDEDAAQFDHIRYKVLKSQQLIRSNILTARNKKEAQFDGLIQYLQDYSFQELLSNNNVVIVEPVRTKIERPLTVGGTTSGPTAKPPKLVKQQTTSAKKPRQRQIGGAAAKRHFFYQPVRVNRELYEDELPDPDTVRNVRRFFEQHVLPTPGQGILVQSQQKFGGSACQLSPKTRRARGYRFLTIDTSYGAGGEEQPKGMELLEEHKVKQHWDNASLSSGISSGDLSSPCGECHLREPEAMAKETPMMACKGVHVLDVVRRHNSNAANAKARAGKLASRRTWCVGGGGGGGAAGDSRYRQIYEQAKLEAEAKEEEEEQREDNQHNGDGDDDDGEEYDDDVETDMCESYYVSNDVLAKIRECGSTVTYYGGRVLERGLPTAATATGAGGHLNPQLLNGCGENAAATRTRSRVRQIEACNECIEQQQHQDQQQDSYQGIKFKLVKSNSCSSRLELAGTEEEANTIEDDNTEVVRKMVHHFECNRPTMMADGQANVTINSQSTASKKEILEGTTSVRRQVTVNNHINMTPQECERLPNGLDKQTQLERDEEATTATYQSQAMNIRLDLSAGRGSDKPNNNSKVCRNRNVDLAYTLAKPSRQQQQQQPVIGNPGTPLGNQKLTKQYNDAQDDEAAVVVGAEHVKPCQQEVIGREQIIVPIEIHQNQTQTQTQTQIQTQAHGQERRLSNASSSASIVDKTVVRHYVANDKSIYERRKYDEIEFEEFEIYDPAKEQERLEQEQEQQQQQQEQHQQQTFQAQDGVNSLSRRQTNDGELYDSLDDRM